MIIILKYLFDFHLFPPISSFTYFLLATFFKFQLGLRNWQGNHHKLFTQILILSPAGVLLIPRRVYLLRDRESERER